MAVPVALPPGLAFLRRLRLPRSLGLLERLYGRALARLGVAWIVTATGVPWKLDLGDVTQRWIVYGDYEGPAQMGWCRRWLARGGVVVDSGASIGQMLLYLAPLPGVRVVAFEPAPQNMLWLRECLATQPGWHVEPVQAALSRGRGSLEFQLAGPHSTTRLDWYRAQAHDRIEVATVSLDGYAQEHGIEHIRLWKLDVEGGEEEALEGASRLLERRAIDAVLVEVSPQSWPGVRDTMVGHGYRAARIDRGGRLRPDLEPATGTENRVFHRDG